LGLGPNFLGANLPLTPFFAFFFFSAWVVARDIV